MASRSSFSSASLLRILLIRSLGPRKGAYTPRAGQEGRSGSSSSMWTSRKREQERAFMAVAARRAPEEGVSFVLKAGELPTILSRFRRKLRDVRVGSQGTGPQLFG